MSGQMVQGWLGRLAGAVVLALGFAGCEPAVEEPRTPVSPTSDGGKAKLAGVADIYARFDFTACASGDNCAKTFALRAGFDLGPGGKAVVPNPRAALGNPDVLWIPEWRRLPEGDAGAHYAFEALALAAVQKSWRSACDKAYAEYDRGLTARLEQLDRAIAEKNRDPNPYDRLGGLLSLETPKPDKTNLHEFASGSDPLRYRWELAVFDAFEDTKRTFVYTFDGHAPSDELLGVMHAREPKSYEEEAFCVEAAKGKIPGVPPLPDTSSWDSGIISMVKKAVPEDRAAAVKKRRSELADVTRARFAKSKVPNPQLPPGVREISTGKVHTFVRDGRKAVVVTQVTREDTQSVGGRTKKVVIDDSATATFEDWPSGVVLDPGDVVTFYGAETSVKELVVKSTPELEHKSRQYQMEGKHITSITTKGKTLKYWK